MTCYLFPVIMTSFNTAASLLLSRATHKQHLTICHTLFKTNCHINVNIKRFSLNRGCGTTARWKTFLNISSLCSWEENPRPALPHIQWLPGFCQQTFPKLNRFLNSAWPCWEKSKATAFPTCNGWLNFCFQGQFEMHFKKLNLILKSFEN